MPEKVAVDDAAGGVVMPEDEELVRSGKDAAVTRSVLVQAARRRFAVQGYRAATVRGIAADAGVNVALINRYFGSKEGLFEACLQRSVQELGSRRHVPTDVDEVVDQLVGHVVEGPDANDPLQLLLLLRSSGDEAADRIRRRMLESYSEKLAVVAGWNAEDPDTEPVLLRAQVAIGAMLGVVMLRASAGVQPLTSSGAAALAAPLKQVLRVLLADPDAIPGSPTDRTHVVTSDSDAHDRARPDLGKRSATAEPPPSASRSPTGIEPGSRHRGESD